MYILDSKKLVIAYSFSFGKTSYEKKRPKEMGRPQDFNLNIFHKKGFWGDFSLFPIITAHTIQSLNS